MAGPAVWVRGWGSFRPRPILSFHSPPFLVSRQQRQDKALLITETRRRFEAEYLPGERLSGAAGGAGGGVGEQVAWERWASSVDVVYWACSVSFFPGGLSLSKVSGWVLLLFLWVAEATGWR